MDCFNCPHCHRVFQAVPGGAIVKCPHCNGTVSLPKEEEIAPGVKIGGFEVIRLIGQGGMGFVYLAIQTSMNRTVALKVLPGALIQDRAAIAKFLQEVRLSGRLQHPNIVTAIDAGEDGGNYYFAMTYVDGETLEDIIERDRGTDEKEAIKYILKISSALNYVWEKHGLLHKDIKPGNIMIDKAGEPFLLDMGIAQRFGESVVDEDGTIDGSPFYMSPEQTRADKLDWSSDLYSLGATLYHAIVGVPPYDSSEITEIVGMHTAKPFPEPKTRNPQANVSRATADLLRKMMGKTPGERFPSWGAFQKEARKALKEVGQGPQRKLAGQKAPPNRKIVLYKRTHLHQSRGSNLGLLIVLILILAAGGGIYYYHYWEKGRQARKAIGVAKEFYRNHPLEHEEALNKFRYAQKLAVGTEAEGAVADLVRDLDRTVKGKSEQLTRFDDVYQRAMELKDERKFQLALETLAGLREVEDQKRAKMVAVLKNQLEKMMEVEARKNNREIESDARRQEGAEKEVVEPEEKDSGPDHQSPEQKRIAEQKRALIIGVVGNGMKRRYSGMAERYFDPARFEDPNRPEAPSEESAAFTGWRAELQKHLKIANGVWDRLYDSGKKFAGCQVPGKGGRTGEILSINGGDVMVKVGNDSRTIPLQEMGPLELSEVLKPTDSGEVFSFFMITGYFKEAEQYAQDQQAKEYLAELAFTFLRARLIEIRQLRRNESAKADRLYSILHAVYQGLPEFKRAEEEVDGEGPSDQP